LLDDAATPSRRAQRTAGWRTTRGRLIKAAAPWVFVPAGVHARLPSQGISRARQTADFANRRTRMFSPATWCCPAA